MVDNSPTTMRSQTRVRTTVVRSRVVVIRGRAVNRNRPLLSAGLALLMAIVAAINLAIGVNMNCYDYYNHYNNCDYRRRAYIISGSCFVASSVGFLVAAIVLHVKIRKAAMLNRSNPPQQPVTVSLGYPGQPVIALTTMSTQYPPPYAPPTGPTPYPFSPAANQHSPPVGFTASPQPMQSYPQEVTSPPSYAP